MRLARPLSVVATVTTSSSSSLAASLPRLSSSLAAASSSTNNNLPWSHVTVEWSPKVAKLYKSQPELFQASSTPITHWVFPDLPQVYTNEQQQQQQQQQQHRQSYLEATVPSQRIQTLATCRHENWRSLVETAKQRLEWTADETNTIMNTPKGKLLLVGGNDKTDTTISTVQAATILRSELLTTDSSSCLLWAVADPNDPDSPAKVQAKIDAGITGFLTQPLLTSTAWETFQSYTASLPNDNKQHGTTTTTSIPFVAGMALPRSAATLQFWKQLLDRPELLDEDPLFQSHLAYFSQPYTTPLAWIGRELQHYMTAAAAAANSDNDNDSRIVVHGVHLMPLQNTADVATILKSLSRQL
jgi:hypothetical protein